MKSSIEQDRKDIIAYYGYVSCLYKGNRKHDWSLYAKRLFEKDYDFRFTRTNGVSAEAAYEQWATQAKNPHHRPPKIFIIESHWHKNGSSPGVQFIERLVNAHTHIPIIMISYLYSARNKARRLGVHYFSATEQPEKLLQVVQDILSAGLPTE